MKPWFLTALFFMLTLFASSKATPSAAPDADGQEASGIKVIKDIAYKSPSNLSDYEKQRCKLDLYLPSNRKNFATLVWFHGGGLEIGDKKDGEEIALNLARTGLAVVCADYRLSPKAKYPSYVADAAAAFAWTSAHIADYGGDAKKIFIGGHSAGGWLALMVGLDGHYLGASRVDLSAVAGIISVSGQTMTHFTVRKERGLGHFTTIADEAAPVYYVRKETPPILMLYADHDMLGRGEEDAYFLAMMKGVGNEHVSGQLIQHRDHNSIATHLVDQGDPARRAILEFIQGQGVSGLGP